jgi:hypothetical protein
MNITSFAAASGTNDVDAETSMVVVVVGASVVVVVGGVVVGGAVVTVEAVVSAASSESLQADTINTSVANRIRHPTESRDTAKPPRHSPDRHHGHSWTDSPSDKSRTALPT